MLCDKDKNGRAEVALVAAENGKFDINWTISAVATSFASKVHDTACTN